MAANSKPPVLVVVQLTGGNCFMNTVIPYTNPHYYDSRPTVAIPQDDVLPINDTLAFHPVVAPLKELYDEGKIAIIQGIGYPNSSRSHFRAMDIMHTCEPEKLGIEGWVAKAIRELDPTKENVVTGVNVGRGLPRALAAPGVPVTSVSDLENFGIMSGIPEAAQRNEALEYFKEMYGPAIGTGPVMDYLAQTGLDVIKGAELLKEAPARYSSEVEYADNPIAKGLRDVARVHTADLGTRIFYTNHIGYDTHSYQHPVQPQLLRDLASAVLDFFQDIRAHQASENVTMLIFTEFGRRIKDNGSGTDHGSGGGAFIIGDRVKGGLYAEYPSLAPDKWLNGEDMAHTIDFRGVYGTVLEQWMGVDPNEIVGGSFEQVHPFEG